MASTTAPAYLHATESKYYRHSGSITVNGVMLGLGTVLAGGALLAVAYAYLLQFVPYVKLRFLLPLAFGAGLGFFPAVVMRQKKVRSLTHGMVVVGVGALACLYVSWCYWIYLLMQASEPQVGWGHLAGLLLQPQVTWDVVKLLAVDGVWGIDKGGAVSGWALWLVWILEALAVVGIALMAARHRLWREPFCEGCDEWCTPESPDVWAGAKDKAELRQRLESKDFQTLSQKAQSPDETTACYRLDLHTCMKCQQTHTLSAVSVKVQNGGTSENIVVDKLLVTPAEAEMLRGLGRKPLQLKTA